jgi:osmotically-inducible protein OsmY
MAERYDGQYRGDRGPQRHDRGLVERAGDEVRSWFGDDDAERRRQMDDREADRYRMRDRMSGGGSWGRGEDRGHDRPNYGSGYRSDRPENPRHGSETGSSRDYRGYEQSYGPYYGQGFGPSYGQGFGPSYGQGYNQSFDQGYGQRSPQHYGQPSGYGDDAGRGRMSGFERPGGSFSGRGPKNYQRSDARINEDVCDRLCESSEVDASEIEVSVSGGEVTLSGTVFDRNDKRRAEDLAEQVSGVREVHNNLRVARGQDRSGVSGPLGLSDAPSTGQGRQAQGQGSVGPSGAGQSGAGTSGASMSTGSNPGITGGGPSGASDASNPSAPEKTSTAGGRR